MADSGDLFKPPTLPAPSTTTASVAFKMPQTRKLTESTSMTITAAEEEEEKKPSLPELPAVQSKENDEIKKSDG
jgi:hypothetical protein